MSKSKSFNFNTIEIINSLRFSSIEIMTRTNENNVSKSLQSMPFLYALFRNHLTIIPDGNFHYLNDYLIVGKNYGGGILKTLVYASNLYPKTLELCFPNLDKLLLPKTFLDFNDGNDCDALNFAVGLSLNQKLINKKILLNKKLNNKIYCIFGEEELVSGKFYELASFAGKQNLSDLICLVDFSGVNSSGLISDSVFTNYRTLLHSLNWNYLIINDGSNVKNINKIIRKAKNKRGPVFIEINTVAGHGTSVAGTYLSWKFNISESEFNNLKERFNYVTQSSNSIIEFIKNDFYENINFRFNQSINYFHTNYKNDLNLKKYIELQNSNNKIFISPNYEKLIDNNDLMSWYTNDNDFNIVISASENIKNERNLIQTNKIIPIGQRHHIASGIVSALKFVNFWNPILFIDFNNLNDFNHWIKLINIKDQSFTTILVDNLDNLNLYVYELNNLKINFVDTWFPYDIHSFKKTWSNINYQKYNLIFLNDTHLSTKTWEQKINFDQKPSLNILTLGLKINDLNSINNNLTKMGIMFNLVPILNPQWLIDKKIINFDSSKLFVLLGINNEYWLNSTFPNIKYLVKSNEQLITEICDKLIKIQSK